MQKDAEGCRRMQKDAEGCTGTGAEGCQEAGCHNTKVEGGASAIEWTRRRARGMRVGAGAGATDGTCGREACGWARARVRLMAPEGRLAQTGCGTCPGQYGLARRV